MTPGVPRGAGPVPPAGGADRHLLRGHDRLCDRAAAAAVLRARPARHRPFESASSPRHSPPRRSSRRRSGGASPTAMAAGRRCSSGSSLRGWPMSCSGWPTSLWLLFPSRLIQGAGGGTTGVAQAYVADTIEPGDRARALGWLSAATSAGVMLGPAIGSFAARINHEAPGFVAAALCLVNFDVRLAGSPNPVCTNQRPRPRPQARVARRLAGRPPAGAVRCRGWSGSTRRHARLRLLSSVLALYLGAEFGVTDRRSVPGSSTSAGCRS